MSGEITPDEHERARVLLGALIRGYAGIDNTNRKNGGLMAAELHGVMNGKSKAACLIGLSTIVAAFAVQLIDDQTTERAARMAVGEFLRNIMQHGPLLTGGETRQ